MVKNKFVLYGYRYCISLYAQKNDIYKDIAKMLKQDLTLQIMNYNGIKICWVKSKNLYLLNRR